MLFYDDLAEFIAKQSEKLQGLENANIPEVGVILDVLGPNDNQTGKPILGVIWLPSRLIGWRLTAPALKAIGPGVSHGFRPAGKRCTRERVRRSSIADKYWPFHPTSGNY